jgi:hypothetical protein
MPWVVKLLILESIKCHKLSGTEIRHKNGHYYVYRVEGYYDKEARKPKSRSLGCIGQICESMGFVPKKKDTASTELATKEYGATRIAMSASTDVFEKLRECFPAAFMRIYVMALLKLLGDLAMKDMDVAYERLAISAILPKVLDHDFPIKELGKVAPYGIYDISKNEGFVNLGIYLTILPSLQ